MRIVVSVDVAKAVHRRGRDLYLSGRLLLGIRVQSYPDRASQERDLGWDFVSCEAKMWQTYPRMRAVPPGSCG